MLSAAQGQEAKHWRDWKQFWHVSPAQQSELLVQAPWTPTQPDAAAAAVGTTMEVTKGIAIAAAIPVLRTISRRDICFTRAGLITDSSPGLKDPANRENSAD
jgi:hypothetical protein